MTGSSPAHRDRLARLAVLAALAAGCSGGSGGSGEPPAASPAITLSAAAVSFSGASFRAELPARSVTVTNGGQGALATPQLSVTYAQGSDWLTAAVTGTSDAYTITLQPTSAALAAGTYTASVSVSSAGASNGPQAISVSLTLTPTWTVLVYGHADGDRPMSFVRDLQEMSEAALGDSVTLIVAADLPAGRSLPTGESFPSGTEWYRIPGSSQGAVSLGSFGEQDFDDPAVLGAAVANAFQAYPADHHALVLWGRGASWRGFGGDEQDTPDDPTDDGPGLTASAIGQAISGALVDLGHASPLAFVAFDASTMMGQEVAYELRDVASVFIASAEVELGGGWDYATSLGRLGADPSVSPFAFAAAEVQDWSAHHTGSADLLVRAHAALDLTQMPTYAAAWQGLASAINGSASPDWLELARRQFATAPGYGAGDPAEPNPRTALRDAGQFLSELGLVTYDPAVAAAAGSALASLDALVISSSTGDLRLAEAQAGVHFEGTLGSPWVADAFTYQALAWHATTAWGDVLEGLAAYDDDVAPEISVVAENTTDPDVLNPPLIRLTSTDGDVAAARLYIARDDGASFVSRGVIADGPVDPLVQSEVVWDGNLSSLSDGVATSAVFVRPWIRGTAGSVFLLPGAISDGVGTPVEAYAVLADGEASVNAVAVGVNGTLAVLPLSDFGGLQFTPALYDESLGAWEPVTTPLEIPSELGTSFTFQRTSAPAGAYRILTTVTDVWGNVREATTDVTVNVPFGTPGN